MTVEEVLKQVKDIRFMMRSDLDRPYIVLIFDNEIIGEQAINHFRTWTDLTITFATYDTKVDFMLYNSKSNAIRLLDITNAGQRDIGLKKFFEQHPDNSKLYITWGCPVNQGVDLQLQDIPLANCLFSYGYILCEADSFHWQNISDRN